MTFLVHSSIVKWGNQLKTTKQDIRDFMIRELKGIEQRFKVLKIYLTY